MKRLTAGRMKRTEVTVNFDCRVYVKDKDGLFYNCQSTPKGFKCGKCGRGVLLPTKRYKCRVCGCFVEVVMTDNDIDTYRAENRRGTVCCGEHSAF